MLLHRSGNKFVNQNGQTIILRSAQNGTFTDGGNGNWMTYSGFRFESAGWSASAVQDELDILEDWGFNCIRIQLSVKLFKEDIDDTRAHMLYLIQEAALRGIYVIVSPYCNVYYGQAGYDQDPLPYPPWTNYEGSLVTPSIADFINWHDSLTDFLKDEPNVIFEVWNEPWGGSGQEDTPMEEFLTYVVPQCMARARANGAQQPFLIMWTLGGVWTHWCSYLTGLSDQNFGMAWHIYPVYGHLAGYTSYADIKSYISGIIGWGSSYPLCISETGIEYGNATSRTTEANLLQILFEENIAWCAHWLRPASAWGGVFTYCLDNGDPTAEGVIFQTALALYESSGENFGDSVTATEVFAKQIITSVVQKAFSDTVGASDAFGKVEVAVTQKAFADAVGASDAYADTIPPAPVDETGVRKIQLLICKPVGTRDDFAEPELSDWSVTSSTNMICNGDTVKIHNENIASGYISKTINVDSSTYRYLVVRYKRNLDGSYFWGKVRDSAGLHLFQNEAVAPSDWVVEIYDLASIASGTLTEIQLGVAGGYNHEVEVDLFFFTTEEPFYDSIHGDVQDLQRTHLPTWLNSTERADTFDVRIDNADGEITSKFAYRDEVHVWGKKDSNWQRVFGGFINHVTPKSDKYNDEYQLINCLGWDSLLYDRKVSLSTRNQKANTLAENIIELADEEYPCGLTTFGIKDTQRSVLILKADYDKAGDKLQAIASECGLTFHVEPNKDASLYPEGKRFLRFGGFIERYFEKKWVSSSDTFMANGDVATLTTIVTGGTGTLHRTESMELDSEIYPKLMIELQGDSASTQYQIKIVTEDDAEYTIQALTACPTSYETKLWDVTSAITGANKIIKDVKVTISRSGAMGTVNIKWLGFFVETPENTGYDDERILLEDESNIHSGEFSRDPTKVRNSILVKGDVFTYTRPLRANELCESLTNWGDLYCTLTLDESAQVGTSSIKATFETGNTNTFTRKASGLILLDSFDGTQINSGYWDKGAQFSQYGEGDSYLQGGKLVNEVYAEQLHNVFYLRWLSTKEPINLSGCVIEADLEVYDGGEANFSSSIILAPEKFSPEGMMANIDGIWVSGVSIGNAYAWAGEESIKNDYVADYVWLADYHHNYFSESASESNPSTANVKIITTDKSCKVYLDGVLKCNSERVNDWTDAYVYLAGAIDSPNIRYPKVDNFKLYKGLKIYVENLEPNWIVELWSGSYTSPESKVAEGTVASNSTIAEIDVSALTFPFTGFFKVINPETSLEDHHSDDYTDIWGGDIYRAQQVETWAVEHMVYYPSTKDMHLNALSVGKAKFWVKHDVAEGESCKFILATDDYNYYYQEIEPTTTWGEQFEFDLGFIQNIKFETVGNPRLSDINFIGFYYTKTSTVTTIWINELHFESETESWGLARDEASIALYGYQPEKIFTSSYKTPTDAQQAADYFLALLKDAPLLKGMATQPWGQFPLHAGDTAIINLPNEGINNEEMIIHEVSGSFPDASTITPMEIQLAGSANALTDPQKRVKEWIERLEKADLYVDEIELAKLLTDTITVTDTVDWNSTDIEIIPKAFSDAITIEQYFSLYGYVTPKAFADAVGLSDAYGYSVVSTGTLLISSGFESGMGVLGSTYGGAGSTITIQSTDPYEDTYHLEGHTEAAGSWACGYYDINYWHGDQDDVKLEFYFKLASGGPASDGQYQYIAALKNTAETDILMAYIYNDSGTLKFGLETMTTDYLSDKVVDNNWHKVTLIRRYTTTTQELYIDDVLEATGTYNYTTQVGKATFGTEYNVNGASTTVRVDNLEIRSL